MLTVLEHGELNSYNHFFKFASFSALLFPQAAWGQLVGINLFLGLLPYLPFSVAFFRFNLSSRPETQKPTTPRQVEGIYQIAPIISRHPGVQNYRLFALDISLEKKR